MDATRALPLLKTRRFDSVAFLIASMAFKAKLVIVVYDIDSQTFSLCQAI